MNFSIPSQGYPRRSDLKSKVQWSDLIVAISEMVAGQLRLPRLQQGQQPHISALPWTQEAIFTTLDHYHANLQNNNQNIVQTVRHYGAQKHIPGKYTFEKNFEFNMNKLCTNKRTRLFIRAQVPLYSPRPFLTTLQMNFEFILLPAITFLTKF